MPWYDLHEQKVISEVEAQTLHRYHGPGRVEWRDDCEDWEIADKQTLILGISDFNALLTTPIAPFTTFKEYLAAKAMNEATARYESSPKLCRHLTMLQAGVYDFECNRSLFIYTQHFLAYYRKPLPPSAPAPTSPGGSSLTRSQRRGARMGRINRGNHKRLQRRS